MTILKSGSAVSLALPLSLAVLLAGCAGTPPARVGPVSNQPVVEYGQSEYTDIAPESYLLRPSDVVSINVFREPDFSVENVPVSAEGNLSLPYLGTIKVEGLTTKQLENLVTQKLQSTVIKNPKVSINVLQFSSHIVTVEGAVEKPGVYPFKPGSRLSAAIALASGPSRVAKLKEVAVFRQTPSGIEVAKFDYNAVSSGTMMDPVLRPNDRVVVGTSGLSQFWQDMIKALPAFAIFTRF